MNKVRKFFWLLVLLVLISSCNYTQQNNIFSKGIAIDGAIKTRDSNQEIIINGKLQLGAAATMEISNYDLIDDQDYKIPLSKMTCEGENRNLDVFGGKYKAIGTVESWKHKVAWENDKLEEGVYFECKEPITKI